MENYIAPEIPDYAHSIIKTAFGSQAGLRSFRWSTGGLYNKVYCVETTEGSFILKIECNRIFPSTRKGQIENEVEGSRLLKQAGISCPPFVYSETPMPTFSTEDLGWHNMIWGHVNNEPDALYVIDFGNSRYVLSYINEYISKNIDMLGCPPWDIPEFQNLDRGYNYAILCDFERMLWKEAYKLTEDYAHIRDWMVAGIESAKKDPSRSHITEFVEKCRLVGQSV